MYSKPRQQYPIKAGEKNLYIDLLFYHLKLRCYVGFKVSLHTLRASAVIFLKQQGFRDTDIMKITGHASIEMVYAYEKSERADNPTKKVSLCAFSILGWTQAPHRQTRIDSLLLATL